MKGCDDAVVCFEQLESRVLLNGVVHVGGADSRGAVSEAAVVVDRTVRAAGDFTTTDGYPSHGCGTDYGVKGAVTTGIVGAHALNWYAAGTWRGMDVVSGTWSVDANGLMQVDFSNADVQNLVNSSLGPTTLYNTRPRTSKVKYAPATAEKTGSISFTISYRTHTSVNTGDGWQEGHITGSYAAQYTIPVAPPENITQDMVGQVKIKAPTKGPDGQRAQFGRFTAGTLHWNKNGTFTYGSLVQNGTWARDASGGYVVNMSLADVQRIVNSLNQSGLLTPTVTSRNVAGCKAKVTATKVDGLQISVGIVFDVEEWGGFGKNLDAQLVMKLQGI